MRKSLVKYDEIVSYEVIENNFKDICRNTKHKSKLLKFDMFHSANVVSLYNELKNKKYHHSNFNIFLISEPKYRIVMSEMIRDKLVNHIVSNVFLKPALYPKLIEENVATRVGKGTDAAIKFCKKYFVRMMNKYEKFYVLKFDISKYFYNIDHEILKSMLREIYVDDDVYKILCEIIDATNSRYINSEIDKCIERERIRLSKIGCRESSILSQQLDAIPYYYDGKGLGIGSLSSQILAIFYLNPLDHYIKEQLGIKEYVRFMDDGIIFSHDKERLKEVYHIIEEKLGELKLSLNSKTEIFSSKRGFEFVGYRFAERNGRMVVRIKNATKRRMKRKFLILGKYDRDKLVRVKASYNGFLKYCTVKSLYKKNFQNEDDGEKEALLL